MFLLPLIASICYFLPPQGWQPARLDDPSSPIELAFIGTPGNPAELPPNISLAFEEVDCTLKEYVQGAKENILSDSSATWRDLGSFKTAAGEARLTESSGPSPWGEVKTLQVLFVKEGRACILTATALKKDFPFLQTTLLSSLKSLTVVPDLWTPVQEHPQATGLKEQLSTLQDQKELEKLSKVLEKDFSQMGAYWHFLVLREGNEKILKQKKP